MRNAPLPLWVRRALQGVAYWIGHRRCLYKGYPLSEGALVAEVCNLIFANLPKDYGLRCEVQYSTFGERHNNAKRDRADLVVYKKASSGKEKSTPKFIIEVKRATT